MTDKCYLLSGLGADGTVFQYLDFEGVEVEYMEWLSPLPKETLPAYAKRMTQKITTPHPILVGLSFGGMVAMEIAKQIPVKKVILISSAKERKELPWFYRFSAKLKLQKILPYTLIKRTNGFTYWLFGATSAHEKALLKEIFAFLCSQLQAEENFNPRQDLYLVSIKFFARLSSPSRDTSP